MRTVVLLSCLNGARFLREQIESLLAQTLPGVEILARDDGSEDGTREILAEYAGCGLLRWTEGGRLGAAKSFWSLLRSCPDADYYAFCDQDDVWDADKLETAVRALRRPDDGRPALYCGDVRVTDAEGNVLRAGMARREPADYPHALFRSLAPGWTDGCDRAARELLCALDADEAGIALHDWTAYQVLTCLGRVVFDPVPHMSYRQHADNAIGATRRTPAEVLRKAKSFLNGPMRNSRSRQALCLERVYGARMAPEERALTAAYAHYGTDAGMKRRLLREPPALQLPARFLFRVLVLLERL